MTDVHEREVQHDIETPAAIQIRFGIEFLAASLTDATVVMSMPMSGLRNPFTGAPTVGPLAILVDAAAGMVNHYRRRTDQWTVSSELSLDVSADGIEAIADGAPPVVASARAVGSVGYDAAVDLHAHLCRHRDRRRHGALVLHSRRRRHRQTTAANGARRGTYAWRT